MRWEGRMILMMRKMRYRMRYDADKRANEIVSGSISNKSTVCTLISLPGYKITLLV